MSRVTKGYWIWGQFKDFEMDILRQIQFEVNRQFKGPSFEIHLTLCGPLMKIDSLKISAIKNICESLEPIKIVPTKYSLTNNFFTSFFLEIKKTEVLIKFRKKFCDITTLNENTNYSPHISLTYGTFPKNEKQELITKLNSFKQNLTLNKICIVDVNEDNFSWNIIKTFFL